MHPTDTLLSLSHARIARAAAAGPRKATQPTALTDRQHMARIVQADPIAVRHMVGDGHTPLYRALTGGDEGVVCITGMTRKGAGFRICGTSQQLRAASEADSDLAQQIDAL